MMRRRRSFARRSGSSSSVSCACSWICSSFATNSCLRSMPPAFLLASPGAVYRRAPKLVVAAMRQPVNFAMLPVTLADVARRRSAACRRDRAHAVRPQPNPVAPHLARKSSSKFENLQFTASFKERGALNKLLSLTPEERKRGVIAMSAGNHAQAVAYHASRLGIPRSSSCRRSSPNTKIRNTQVHGARSSWKENLFEAGKHARARGARQPVFVPVRRSV